MVDTFAHGLLSWLMFRKLPQNKQIWLSVFFGVMPDLFSWTIYLLYGLFLGGGHFTGPPELSRIPPWVFTLYGVTHSLFVFGAVILLVFLLFKKVPVYLLAWGLHIAVDIPTHSREFLPTPFLWPVSEWQFPGLSWGTGWFFISYWCVLLGWSIVVFVRSRAKKR
jgi:hypothetical protein